MQLVLRISSYDEAKLVTRSCECSQILTDKEVLYFQSLYIVHMKITSCDKTTIYNWTEWLIKVDGENDQ